MTKQETALRACAILEEYYPKSVCALQYKEPYELLIAVRLRTVYRCTGQYCHENAVPAVSNAGIVCSCQFGRTGAGSETLRVLSHESEEHQRNGNSAADGL